MADSDASPITSLFKIGIPSCPSLKTDLEHRQADFANAFHSTDDLSNWAPKKLTLN